MHSFTVVLALALTAVLQQAPDPALKPLENPDPKLPNVLVIGDSISMGYTLPLRERLNGKANVYRIPENAAHTKNGAAKIEKWLGETKWAVITVNFGLHDLKVMPDGSHQVELEPYSENLKSVLTQCKAAGAKVLFITTTPVPEGKLSPLRKPGDEKLYNEAATKVAKELQVDVFDLYAFVQPNVIKWQRKANVHFIPAGSKAMADAIGKRIEQHLNKPGNPERLKH